LVRIALLASGGGSNADNLLRHLQGHDLIHVALIACNKPDAGAFQVARKHNVSSILLTRQSLYHSNSFLETLQELEIDMVVLAGFLWKIPPTLVQAFPQRIVNIHPALLPRFGGKGMYGHHVHEAVKAANESQSGITIHWVNELYDDGAIIFQAATPLTPDDTPQTIEQKVRALEAEHFPIVVEKLALTIA
jgi:phosphoribosylglycinamide formyltransferase 1